MKIKTAKSTLICCFVGLGLAVAASVLMAQAPPTGKPGTFKSPEEAADAVVNAAEKFDVAAFQRIFGTEGQDIILTGETAYDKEVASAFAAEARTKKTVTIDSSNKNRAQLVVGSEDWPFPLPIVKRGDSWVFDVSAGRQELVYRRIGRNELDAIEICQGYVEAQHDYAFMQHNGVNQYAQRIISTPGKQDGLAWKNEDGSWDGPIGVNVARAIENGYGPGDPYHGYYFKVLTGQGPAAPLGEMDFVVKGMMIGGFALIATPAQYGITGVKTFMVSHDGVVYEKDLGTDTLEKAKKLDRFNPDKTWSPVSP